MKFVSLISFYMLIALFYAVPMHGRPLIIVAMHEPPYAYMSKEKAGGEKATGIAVEAVRAGLRRAGVECHISLVPWKRALHMAFTGKADAIFKVVWSEERAKHLYYTEEPLAEVRTIAYRQKGSTVKLGLDYAEAGKLRIGVGSGFLYGPPLDGALKKGVFGKVDEAYTEEKNIEKLLGKRIDLVFADEFPGFLSLCKMNALDKVEILTDDQGQEIAFAVSKTYLAFSRKTVQPALVRRFSRAIKEMRHDGTLEAIRDKHVRALLDSCQ